VEKFYSSSLLNFLALFGWINALAEVFYLVYSVANYPHGALNYNIATHNFLRHTVSLFLIYMSIVILVFWCQRFRPFNECAFGFPYEKIKRRDLFYVFFYGGLTFMVVPFAILISMAS